MNLAALKTETEHETALTEIEKLMDSELPCRDRLELLVQLVCTYEDEHYPVGPPDPFEAIKFRMEQTGHK